MIVLRDLVVGGGSRRSTITTALVVVDVTYSGQYGSFTVCIFIVHLLTSGSTRYLYIGQSLVPVPIGQGSKDTHRKSSE